MRIRWALLFVMTGIAGCSGHGTNFTGANLSGANFTGTNLSDAILTGAIYDKCTRFPDGFNPSEHGMVRVEKQGDCVSATAAHPVTPATPAAPISASTAARGNTTIVTYEDTRRGAATSAPPPWAGGPGQVTGYTDVSSQNGRLVAGGGGSSYSISTSASGKVTQTQATIAPGAVLSPVGNSPFYRTAHMKLSGGQTMVADRGGRGRPIMIHAGMTLAELESAAKAQGAHVTKVGTDAYRVYQTTLHFEGGRLGDIEENP